LSVYQDKQGNDTDTNNIKSVHVYMNYTVQIWCIGPHKVSFSVL